jgi:EmrB/QacA subfamily drug resistance transporter
MVVVSLALAAVVAAMVSLNVALPDLARSTGASQTQLEWIVDAYSLLFASLLLPAGALGDRYGRRRALIAGLAVFAGASALALTSHSANELIVLRGVLGVGAAFVMPATLSTITTTFPPEQRTRAVGVWAGVAGGSAVLGLVSSGALLQHFSWKAVFVVNIVVAVVALIGVLAFVPETSQPSAARLDKVGALLSMTGLVALVFSIIEAPDTGWLAPRTLAGFAGGLGVLALFVLWELRTDHPLFDPRHFRSRFLTAGSSSIFVQFFAFYGFTFVALQYLQGVRGYSPLQASLSMLPFSAAMMPMSRIAPRLVARVGSRAVSGAGLLLMGTGMVILSELGTGSPFWRQLAGLVVLGVGLGAATIPATTAITEALPMAEQGVGSALNDLSREVGGALGIAVLGSILSAAYRSALHLSGVPAPLATRARSSFAIAVHAGGHVQTAASSAFVHGLHVALLVAAGTAFAAAIGVVALMRSERAVPTATIPPVPARATALDVVPCN